jgi:hypothetical protein
MWNSVFIALGMFLLALVLGLVLHDLFTVATIEGALLLHFGADGALLDLAKVILGGLFLLCHNDTMSVLRSAYTTCRSIGNK